MRTRMAAKRAVSRPLVPLRQLTCRHFALSSIACAATPAAERRVRFRRTPASLNPYLDTWDDSFRTLGADARPAENGFYVLQGARRDASIHPFAENAQQSGRVRLFGSPTGGNLRGINGGCFFFVRLPASGIEFDLQLMGYFRLRPEPDSGIAPDVLISASIADVAAGRDPVMARAANWVHENG
ncbi:hypothetical protein LTR94_002293 [Friedmanniomyces endolithicus]|nr:hypothetical protein LTR94_002293 [Friedmanniomyces endolithicus]